MTITIKHTDVLAARAMVAKLKSQSKTPNRMTILVANSVPGTTITL